MGQTRYIEIRPLDAEVPWNGAPCTICGEPCDDPCIGLEQVEHEHDISTPLYDGCRDLPGYGGPTRTMRYKSGRWAIGHWVCLETARGETEGYTSILEGVHDGA